jgi:hypothetical protein
MVFNVELVMSLHQLHIRAQPPRFVHQRPGFYAEGFFFLLLARGKKAVQIEDEPAQHFMPPRAV